MSKARGLGNENGHARSEEEWEGTEEEWEGTREGGVRRQREGLDVYLQNWADKSRYGKLVMSGGRSGTK